MTDSMRIKQLFYIDSLKNVLEDSLKIITEDSLKKVLEDSIKNLQRDSLLIDSPKKDEELEKRKLPQIKENLMKNNYHLAEFFLLQVQNYDSALYNYKKFLTTYSDSVLTPKGLYSIYFIYSQPVYYDSLLKDSLEHILINQYSKSPFALEILKRKGTYQEKKTLDSLDVLGRNLFLKAENLYETNQIDSALALYKIVADIDSNLIWSVKAQLARAWIYEHDLNNVSRAIEEYTYLKDNYPQSEFIKLASIKIAPPPKETFIDTSLTSQPDSIIAALPSDTTKVIEGGVSSAATGSSEEGIESLPLISTTEKYKQWRLTRNRK